MNTYANLSQEELKEHLDNYLIDHWSVSSIAEFIRNEKSFERKYVYKDYSGLKSTAAIIGIAYHHALMVFFQTLKDSSEALGFDSLIQVAFEALDKIGAHEYKPQKDKTIFDLKEKALAAVNSSIKSFLAEQDAYLNEIQEILFVEQSFKEFITLNDIDIPVPLVAKPDMVFINKDGELAILDHKSKYAYTSEKDIDLKYSNQAIGYALALNEAIKRFPDILAKYPKAAEGVKRFYFYENKYSENRDKSRQIRQIPIDLDVKRGLYEQILFEGVFRVMEAIQNPDYVYLMNPNDIFQESGEVIEFWVKTHVEGLDGFPNLKPAQRDILAKRKTLIRRAALTGITPAMVKTFANPKAFVSLTPSEMQNLSISEKIEHRLRTFNYPVKVEHVIEGYSCDTYLVQIAAGLKTSAIYGYRMDIANVLGVRDVRIAQSLVEYQGSAYVAIEINRKNQTPLILEDAKIPEGYSFPIGQDNFGNVMAWDIASPSTPHMMIAGSSGSGKSVSVRTILSVALAKGIKVTILDPKFEFTAYADKALVLNELSDIEAFMEAKVKEMDSIFRKGAANQPKQLVVFDEAADCFARQTRERKILIDEDGDQVSEPGMAIEEATDFEEAQALRSQWAAYRTAKRITDDRFKTLEENTLILAQKARSAGIHLLLAAQRFSVKVLSGDAKANFTTRLCLTVASPIDSRVMLDQEGAERLNGKGDALYTSPEHSEPVRIQCFSTL